MKNRVLAAAALVGASSIMSTAARANLTGFGGFAVPNQTINDAGTVGTITGVGYSNGGATFNLTSNANQEAVTGFATTPQDISGSFTATFTYQETPSAYDTGGANGATRYVAADGFDFILQNDTRGTAALGGDGGSRGYGAPNAANTTHPTVTNSAAVEVDNFGGLLNFQGAVGYGTNGATNTPNTLGAVNISRGASPTAVPINVTYAYDAGLGSLRETFVDPGNGATFSHVETGVNIAASVGGKTAYIGFGGGTGGYNAAQTISNFTFTTGAGSTPVPPVPATAVFSPVAVTGFNKQIVVPAIATNDSSLNYVNATMDAGPFSNLVNDPGDTWFEKGFDKANPTYGIPTGGSNFVSANDSRHTFAMPAFATASGGAINDTFLLDQTAADKTATMAFATPITASALSFLVASGNGPAPFSVLLTFSDGTTEALGDLSAPDWFNNGAVAAVANGRFDVDTEAFDSEGSGNPKLFQVDVGVGVQTKTIASITLGYDGTGTALSFFGVSAAPVAVPEPTSVALIGLAGLGMLRRRRPARA